MLGVRRFVAAAGTVPSKADRLPGGFDNDGPAASLGVGWGAVPESSARAFGELVAVAAQADDAG